MAGAGYKLFNTGDVLTAAQVNTYLQEQTVMVFASSTARTTALSGVLAEGMMSYLQDTNSVEVYNGTSWVALASGDLTEIVAGTGITVTSGTGPIPTVALTTPVAATNGGTAQSTYTTGDLLYASATNTLAKRAIGSTDQVLKVSGGIPTWAVDPTTDVVTTAGDLIYGTGADAVTRLGIGTAGQVLTVNSGATAPQWSTAASSGGMTVLASGTLSGAAVNLTSISGSYNDLVLVVRDFYPTAGASGMRVRFNNNSTANNYITTRSRTSSTTTYNGTDTAFYFDDFATGPATSDQDQLGILTIKDYANATTKKVFEYLFIYQTSTSVDVAVFGGGAWKTNAAINELNIAAVSGNVAGTYILYGVK